jgi:membrane-bound lytic murein transglycosylase D
VQQRQDTNAGCQWGCAVAWSAVVLLLLACAGSHAQAHQPTTFPLPEVLRPNVAFWTRVFTQLDGRSGVLHDSDDVSRVYRTLRNLPTEPRKRRRVVNQYRRRYRNILRRLAAGPRHDLDQDEKRVLALFKGKRSSATLRVASENIRFQLGLRDRFVQGLQRSGAYMPTIRQVFAAAGLPTELGWLPHVESSFNNQAYSKYGAAGMWQFTRGTGRLFLRINDIVDERFDFRRATRAAAQLLRQHYQELGTWPLAITAYNHGVAGMKQAVARLGTRAFGTIVQRYQGRAFKFASKNFYAEFLAVIAVVRAHRKYFPDLAFDKPTAYHTLKPDSYVDIRTLSRYLQVRPEEIARWNPSLRRLVLQSRRLIPAGHTLYIPQARMSRATLHARWAQLPRSQKFVSQLRDTHYRVRRGDTLVAIAQRHGTTVAALRQLNRIRRPDLLRVGRVLKMPAGARRPAAPHRHTHYRVRRGDTLVAIAQRHGTTVAALRQLNRIRRPDLLRVGQVLRVAGAARPPVAVSPKRTHYRVRRGDTLVAIAQRHGTTVATLRQLNRIRRPDLLRVGRVLKVAGAARGLAAPPPHARYRVRRGDTLVAIAQRFGTTVSTLRELNDLKRPDLLRVGQVLKVPAGAPEARVSALPANVQRATVCDLV